MSANPVANGGLLRTELHLPDFRDFAVEVDPGARGRASTPSRPACSAAGSPR